MEMIHSDDEALYIGFDMEWEFTTGFSGTGPQKTALIQIALPQFVYLLQVFLQKNLPVSLQGILCSSQIKKVGRNIGADLAKLS